MRFRRGLVVGKFSPLHLGHELLIDRALGACDDLVVISYSKPEYPGCDRQRRLQWLTASFPQTRCLVLDDVELARLCREANEPVRTLPHNDESDEAHRAFVGWICVALLSTVVDAVFTSEDYGDGFAAELAAFFRRCGHPDARVAHVCVDRTRSAVPISGSAVRADVHGQSRFLSRRVYASFVERVCLLGGESSGKTTLAEALADRLGTVWVPEYGRELWIRKGGRLTFEDMLDIARTQVASEREASMNARRWLVCDTSPLTTLFYCLDAFGRSHAELDRWADRDYAHVFLCEPDFEFVQDGSRRDAGFRSLQHDWYRSQLAARRIAYRILRGGVAERVEAAVRCLRSPA